jgi:hypothetical protein
VVEEPEVAMFELSNGVDLFEPASCSVFGSFQRRPVRAGLLRGTGYQSEARPGGPAPRRGLGPRGQTEWIDEALREAETNCTLVMSSMWFSSD